MKVFIEFLNKQKNYQVDKKYFKTYESALHWGRRSLNNFHSDMIQYVN
jgi:hypothetical protein